MMASPLAIFDMDGTLVDSMFYWKRTAAAVLNEMGICIDDEADESFLRIGYYHIPEYVVERYGLPCSAEEFLQKMDNWVLERYRTEILMKPGVREYLASLRDKGVRCVILTASKTAFIDAFLTRYKMHGYFSATYSANALGMEKSNPAIYDVIFDQMQCTAADCVLFDDSDYAITTAAASGLRTVGILDPLFEKNHEALRQHATRTVHRYRELIEEDIF